MKSLSVYHNLPYPLKVLSASAWGYYLHWWRYGKETETLVQEALDKDSWVLEKIQSWQEDQLARILYHAATRVPYYQNQWQNRRKKGDRSSWEILNNWPVLTKKMVQENTHLFISGENRPYFTEHTSGSTGTPLTLLQNRQTLHKWYALFEARTLRWNSLQKGDRWAIIGGQMVAPFNQVKPPFWVWNHAFHQLYLSSYNLKQNNIDYYLSAIQKHQILYILGYASSLYLLAELARDYKLKIPQLMCVISNAEPLYDYQRDLISRVFGCPVVNTYGMSELVCGASECNNKSLHIWPEAGIIEILDDQQDQKVPDGSIGRIISTGMINKEMPLIRYQTGDRGSLKTGVCNCGRNLQVFQNIEGRIDDMIILADGRKIGRLDPVFKADIPIREAQIIQETLDTIRIRFVPGLGYNHDELLFRRLRERLGNMNIILDPVQQIPRGKNGKFRAVISMVK